MNERLEPDGKAVLITGSARGIGNAVAKHLDSRGFHVFASCLNPNSPGAKDLRKSCSSRLKILQLDVSNDESVSNCVEFVKKNLGESELWAVVNNAGIQNGFLTELTSIQEFKDSTDVNTIGQIRITKAFLPLLKKSKGRVVNMTSLSGRLAFPFVSPYTVSKFASVGFSECLRFELDVWGIKVVSIEPELFETDMTNRKLIQERIGDLFHSIDEDVRRDYGEELIRAVKVNVPVIINPSPKIEKVIEAIDSAISLKDPDAVYRVYRNIFVAALSKILEFTPTACFILVIRALIYVLGIPKPKAANKRP
ncbi:Estradiol 17-beta-dehydrogenase 2 [Araneus ventricosus]|uniref:Estradiol 17-beta-dehydrogenase 2 n=1 Tax=Araneus ventricosus TaxID=182803 RepID=A0A4Y2GEY3_ARAVE|nr:Estradiol 17-beta-dehydrogenase 2 [Araneus ventricosus]